MPYATNGQISKRPIDGGVEISDKEYDEARSHALSGGLIKTHNGEVFLTSKPEQKEGHKDPVWQGGDWHHEPLPDKTQDEKEHHENMVVTRFQAKVALHDANLLDQVESYIAQTDNVRLKFAWQEASFKRNSVLIATVTGELGLSDDQVDDLFEYAANVTE